MRLFAAMDMSPETQEAMAPEQERIAPSLTQPDAALEWFRPIVRIWR